MGHRPPTPPRQHSRTRRPGRRLPRPALRPTTVPHRHNTRDQITATDNNAVRLHLGATHIDLPEPLDALFIRLTSERRPHTGVGSPASTPWLFAGLDPGRPLTAYQLGQRLRRLDIDPAAGRRAALAHLAARLPAAMLAKLVNLTPTTAVRWVRAVGGDWTTYAAQIVHDRDREA